MNIDTICDKCIEAIKDAGYNESTIFNYQGVIRRFKTFCEARDVSCYSSEIGQQYVDDVISNKTGKYSLNRYHTQGRFYGYFKNTTRRIFRQRTPHKKHCGIN